MTRRKGPRLSVRGNCRRESAGQSFRYAPLVSNSHDKGARYAARLPRIGLIIITAQEGRGWTLASNRPTLMALENPPVEWIDGVLQSMFLPDNARSRAMRSSP